MTRLRALVPLLRPTRFSTSATAPTASTASPSNGTVAPDKEPFSIYIHWPYCSSKCTYCNFNKYVDPNVDNERMERSLVTELKSELAYWGLDQGNRPIRSIYFGELGRDHTPSTALRSLLDARAVWPGKVSMDLIMGHTGQTLEDWEKELRFTMDIVDDHLSLYHLTVEPGTALHKDVVQGKTTLPDSDLSTDMYEATIQLTREAGFEHYEVSNFARNKAYSMHNSGHWFGIDYLGLGPGAHGRMSHPQTRQKFRTFNVRDPAGWMHECEEQGTGQGCDGVVY
ncbi:radical S-adenosyl methionine domain-containing protein 1 [Linnemannia gamsii]|uniref:Radical S-adenosyl methionine domain-containing protein 1 n=1 Tax=Linnemannia gamsii TaxID=64522 RepID=A0ABQ7KI96_9FUNG|nr:radical S-adenosyl methionine domain-containing protein 1 [Linnemannia gamsii]